MSKIVGQTAYEEILKKIKTCVQRYENLIENNAYTLALANGEFLNIRIPRNQVPHLLGIQIDNLKNSGVVKKDISSYEILKKIIKPDITYYDIKNHNVDFSNLFSDYVDKKLEIFVDNMKIRTDDVYAIVKYDVTRTYTTGKETENSDYFIIRYINNMFYVLGIANLNTDKFGNNYVPVTSRRFDNYQELTDFLEKVAKNQELTYAYSFKIEDFSNDFSTSGYLNDQVKKGFIERIIRVASKYKAIPSVGKDFLYSINKSLNNYQKSNNNKDIISMLDSHIKDKNVLSVEDVIESTGNDEIPEELKSLIDTCNDMICSDANISKTASNTYSSLQDENIKLKEELKEYKRQLEIYKQRKDDLTSENESLKEENNNCTEKLKKLGSLLEEINKVM